MRAVLTDDAHKDVPFAAFYFNTVDGEFELTAST